MKKIRNTSVFKKDRTPEKLLKVKGKKSVQGELLINIENDNNVGFL